jgi:hypothetical protein
MGRIAMPILCLGRSESVGRKEGEEWRTSLDLEE